MLYVVLKHLFFFSEVVIFVILDYLLCSHKDIPAIIILVNMSGPK
jgi:hypothetical protein